MRLKSVRVQNYRSVVDSGTVEIDPQITGIVGMTGSGKTSFLRMVSGIDKAKVFYEHELPKGSTAEEQFRDGSLQPERIPQLCALFEVEDSDVPLLPSEYAHVKEITVTRTFGGNVDVTTIPDCSTKINIDSHTLRLQLFCDQLAGSFASCTTRVPSLASDKGDFESRLRDLPRLNLHDRKQTDLAVNSLRDLIEGGPADVRFRADFRAWTKAVARLLEEVDNMRRVHPARELEDMIPKPYYMDRPFELDGEVALDAFIDDMSVSKTFYSIAVITGLTSASIREIRSAQPASQKSYLDTKSDKLSGCLNKSWKQEQYEFSLEISDGNLILLVRDSTTGTRTSVRERSAGFQWWTSFFLEISAFMASDSGRQILLLDNPATELHDEGKADVLRFMTDASESGRLQILYSTHERALVSPWRLDQIRAVDLTSDGSEIRSVKNMPGMDLAGTVLKYIGSPARYSLFGAPRMVSLEGVSDTYIVSAVNEYMELRGFEHLKKDLFSINAVGGIGNVPAFYRLYRDLGLDFLFVVDSGTATENMKKNMEDGDPERFVEIRQVLGRDGDTEDLIDRVLYHEAFSMAYGGILDKVPGLDEIESSGAGKKRTTQYAGWFKAHGREFNKTIVAQCLHRAMLGDHSRPDEPAKRTAEQFQKLFEKIWESNGA